MQLYNHRIVKCPLAFQSVQYNLKSWWIADEIESKLLQPFCLFSFFSFTFAVHYGIFRLKKYLRFFQPSKILPTILKDSSNRQGFFQLSKKILPTIKDSSNRAREKNSHRRDRRDGRVNQQITILCMCDLINIQLTNSKYKWGCTFGY